MKQTLNAGLFESDDEPKGWFLIDGVGIILDEQNAGITFLFTLLNKNGREKKVEKLFDYMKTEGIIDIEKFGAGERIKTRVMVLNKDSLN